MKGCLLSTVVLVLLSSLLLTTTGQDRLQPEELLNATQKITSSGDTFALGFFTPANSTNRYVGIWYDKIKEKTVIWVANRENPLTDSTGFLTLSGDGNIKVLDGKKSVVWSSNISVIGYNSTTAVLLDNGNLVLRTTTDQAVMWQSFDHPIGSFLPGMKLWLNTKTGQSIRLLSWKDVNDPTPGVFSVDIDPQTPRQLVMWRGSEPYWRDRIWEAVVLAGLFQLRRNYVGFVTIVFNNDEISYSFSTSENSLMARYVLTPMGVLELQLWDDSSDEWKLLSSTRENNCSVYGLCGPFGSCDNSSSPTVCNCLKGFQPQFQQDWEKGNWSGGCVRKVNLECGTRDGFLTMKQTKLPDRSILLANNSPEACASECLGSCSCTAYSYTNVSAWGTWKCLMWVGDLIDLVENYDTEFSLNIRLAGSELGENSSATEFLKNRRRLIAIVLPLVTTGILIISTLGYFLWKRLRKQGQREIKDTIVLLDSCNTVDGMSDNIELPLFSFSSIVAATNNFSATNKLGQGGFGAVYRGNLFQGLEIAVKRLSKNSVQGQQEFRNEVQLIAKLQHKYLVRLLGWCIQEEEKILIYEFMPNKSLDKFLFDPAQQSLLDWSKRYHIVQGVAQGLDYLHHYSRLRVIHRDLKASNILLDDSMNPKISDFGLARIFDGNQTEANTNRVMGTYGYMSPEYALDGIFSEKSDVYSFGVLVIEIVSGKKNAGYYPTEHSFNLLGLAWQLWNEDRSMEFIDTSMGDSLVTREAMKCVCIGLLRVQEDPADRPNMSYIVSMLGNETATLPSPKQPAFPTIRRHVTSHHNASSNSSVNVVTVSIIEPR